MQKSRVYDRLKMVVQVEFRDATLLEQCGEEVDKESCGVSMVLKWDVLNGSMF